MSNTQNNLPSVEEQNSTKNARSYLERNVTKYTSVTETTGVPRTIAQCLAFIRDNEKQAALVEALRPLYQRAEELCLKQTDEAAKAAYQEAKSEYDAAKKKLSAVTLSGTFTKRGIAGLETYSGIIQADLDHLHREGVDICELKKRLSLDPHVLFCFVSPGGDGFKIGIPVATGPEDHTEAFLAMQRYFESTYGILPDDACKDVSRLCFLSSDPEIFINENAVALDWRAWPEPAARIVEEELTRSVAGSSGSRENKPDKAAVASMLAATPKRPDYTDWLRIVAAVGDALDDDDAIEVLSAWSPEEHPGEYLEKLHSGMDQVHIGTLIHLAKANGWTDWPEIQPLPPEHPPVAPFDYGLLPSTFIPYARDVAERMQCPPDYVAVGLMCSVGSLVGRKVGIHPKRKDDWLEVCNLWGAVVGPPSIMKSPALSDAMLPLNKLVADAIERHKEDCAAFADAKEVRAAGKEARKTALTKALKELGEAAALDMAKKQRTEAKDEPICERFTVNDVTIEKLGMLLNENPNGLLQFRDELVGWLRCMDKDGHENDRAFLLECWNGKGSYTSDRVERGTQHIEAAIVGVLGGIQPGVLAKYIREASGSAGGSDGLLQRFNLIVWPEITPMFINVDRYPNKEAKEAVMAVFERLHKLDLADMDATTDYSTIPALRFSDDAQERFDQWREEFENSLRTSDEHPALISHLTKHRKAVPVLALVIHLCVGGTGAVGLEPLEKALRWHEYLKTHAAKVYGGIRNGGALPARELLRRIREGDIKDGFTAREIYRRHLSGIDDKETVEAGIEVLTAANYLREVITQTGGSQIVRYHINPKISPQARTERGSAKGAIGGKADTDGANGTFGTPVSQAPEGESEEL